MYSRYSDVSLKNNMWRKIWICNNEVILMMFKNNILKNEAKEELSKIGKLTSRFILSEIDLHFFARNPNLVS
jgi:ribosome biogenesis protein Nip4